PQGEPERGNAATPRRADPAEDRQPGGPAEDEPAERVGRPQDAQEVVLLEAEQELLIVREPHEREIDPAGAEDELRDRQGEGGDERKEREGENQEDGGPDEEPSGRAVGAPRVEGIGRSPGDGAP